MSPQRVGTIWTHELREPLAEIEPELAEQEVPAPVTYRRESTDGLEGLARFLDAPAIREFEQRLKDDRLKDDRSSGRGRRFYTVWSGEELAGYGWVSFGAEYVGELDLWLRLEPCEAYLWDFYTLPDYRGRHVYAALLVWITRALGAEPELCRAWIGADLANQPSQRGIDRAGYRRVADLLIEKRDGRRLIWAEGYPGVEERLVDEARRVYLGG